MCLIVQEDYAVLVGFDGMQPLAPQMPDAGYFVSVHDPSQRLPEEVWAPVLSCRPG